MRLYYPGVSLSTNTFLLKGVIHSIQQHQNGWIWILEEDKRGESPISESPPSSLSNIAAFGGVTRNSGAKWSPLVGLSEHAIAKQALMPLGFWTEAPIAREQPLLSSFKVCMILHFTLSWKSRVYWYICFHIKHGLFDKGTEITTLRFQKSAFGAQIPVFKYF